MTTTLFTTGAATGSANRLRAFSAAGRHQADRVHRPPEAGRTTGRTCRAGPRPGAPPGSCTPDTSPRMMSGAARARRPRARREHGRGQPQHAAHDMFGFVGVVRCRRLRPGRGSGRPGARRPRTARRACSARCWPTRRCCRGTWCRGRRPTTSTRHEAGEPRHRRQHGHRRRRPGHAGGAEPAVGEGRLACSPGAAPSTACDRQLERRAATR